MLRKLGFFSELPHGDADGPSLVSSVRGKGEPDESRIISYLDQGVLFIGCSGVTYDVLGDSSKIIGSPHILTDGVWAWPADVVYYLKKYHVVLSEDFVAHIRQRRYLPAKGRTLKLESLEL